MEKLKDITSVQSAIGNMAGTIVALEQLPVISVIRTYNITVEFLTER